MPSSEVLLAYIREHYEDERSGAGEPDFSCAFSLAEPAPAMYAAAPKRRSLAELLGQLDEPFNRMMLRLIDEKGLTDAEVYKRANIDRKHFSKLRKDGSSPGKGTVLALAVGMRLSLDETRDLLGRAGFAISHSSISDVIVECFISEGEYDIFAINEALLRFGQKPLAG